MRNVRILAAVALVLGLAGPAAAATDGQQVFLANCAACHQATGLGRPPTFPALKGDKFVLGPKAPVVATVLNGRGGMPAWKGELSDDEVAGALTYVRASWGNKAPAVTPKEVAAARSGGKTTPQKGLQAH
jgi:mono/diheme cytochrome c family protein